LICRCRPALTLFLSAPFLDLIFYSIQKGKTPPLQGGVFSFMLPYLPNKKAAGPAGGF